MIEKAAAERKEKFSKIIVGIPGKELSDEIARSVERKEKARKFWKDAMGIDIDDGRIEKEGGYSPDKVIKKALKENKFEGMSMHDKIQLCAELQRKNLKKVYTETCPTKQNMKQEAALVMGADTVRGCLNNCISCYSCINASGINSIKFDVPVACDISGDIILSKEDIKKQKEELDKEIPTIDPKETKSVSYLGSWKKVNVLETKMEERKHKEIQLKEMEKFGIDHTVLRIGVNGGPATNWAHTNRVIKNKLEECNRKPDSIIFVSKLQRIDGFDPKVVRNMHVSVDPLNREQMERTMSNLLKIREQDPSLNILLRIRSFDSKNKELQDNLMKAVKFANDNDFPVLETKMRFKKTIAEMMEMNMNSYHFTKGGNFKANHNFLGTEGVNFVTGQKEKFENNPYKVNKHLECDSKGKGCEACGNCMNTVLQNYPWKKDFKPKDRKTVKDKRVVLDSLRKEIKGLKKIVRRKLG